MLARLFRSVIAAAALCLAITGHAKADLFTSPLVPVDVRAESAQTAQLQALAQARAAGLAEVMKRLVAPSDHGRLNKL